MFKCLILLANMSHSLPRFTLSSALHHVDACRLSEVALPLITLWSIEVLPKEKKELSMMGRVPQLISPTHHCCTLIIHPCKGHFKWDSTSVRFLMHSKSAHLVHETPFPWMDFSWIELLQGRVISYLKCPDPKRNYYFLWKDKNTK